MSKWRDVPAEEFTEDYVGWLLNFTTYATEYPKPEPQTISRVVVRPKSVSVFCVEGGEMHAAFNADVNFTVKK